MPTRQDLIAKIEAWAKAHNVPVDDDIRDATINELIWCWVRLQMAE